MNIMVVGTGYVGLVQGACLAHLGHRVACVDVNQQKVAALQRGEVPFFEPGLPELVSEGIESGRLSFHVALQDAVDAVEHPDIVSVAVPTPRSDDGSCDLSAVESVCRELGGIVDKTLLVIKSTVPPGVRSKVREWLGNDKIGIASNPEFLREGKSVQDFFHPERIVIGAEKASDAEFIRRAHEGIDAPVFVMSVESAQLAKYAANTMLASRLALVNEIANIADAVCADIKDVEAVLGSDPRIGSKFLRTGAGFGGSCFPKDVLALADVAKQKECESLLIQPIIETNDRQPLKFVEKFGDVSGKKIAVWGLAFNKETDDVRESPALVIVRELVKRGAEVSVYDPEAMESAKKELGEAVNYAESMTAALEGADMLAVLTEWPQFASADWEAVKSALKTTDIFDGKNFLPRERLEEIGFDVHGMGLCAKHERRPHAS